MTVWIRVEEGCVREAAFEAQGCAPSIAAGSVLTELMRGRSVYEAREIRPGDIEEALGGLPPIKRHCALLASRAARLAVSNFESRESNP